ncbi:MFS transporter [Streptomyces alanosinicus]|uniref:MFS transporter n=1 Tax=Streptomyces alanosinicus TaxID=68171 RepID=A0A919D2M8_9ACTN|nr:MFS transporter [Streptomyces alanosinicus]GHE05597.1 MFS transporter [Streptomyces alanosinicus]
METIDPPASVLCREVRDRRGRVYRVGESDVDLLGRGRIWMVVLPWVGMAGISGAAYAFVAAQAGLRDAHRWGGDLYWPAGLWALSQAAVALPAGRLRESGRLSARAALTGGALGTLAGCLALAAAPGLTAARLACAVCAGAGAGLVHTTCLTLPGRWWPERRGGPTGLVASGLAVGAVPFLPAPVRGADPRLLLAVAGAGAALAVAGTGLPLRDPPRNWWPPGPDPRSVPADPGARRAREKNPPAVRHHTLREAARSPVLWLMWLCLLGAAGVTVLGVWLLPAYGRQFGLGGRTVWSMTVVGGGAAAVAGVLSDRSGRRTALVTACLVLAGAQFGVPVAARTGSGPLLLGCAAATAAAGAAALVLVTALAADHFGENHHASVQGLLTGAWLLPVAVATGARAAGYTARAPHSTFLLAGCTGLVCAAVALFLRAPGRLSVRRIVPNPHPLGEEMA